MVKVGNKIRMKSVPKKILFVPPIPMFGSIDSVGVDGIVLKRLFPISGVISKACMLVGSYSGDGAVKFTLSSDGKSLGSSISFETRKSLLIEDIDLRVEVGDLLTLSTDTPGRVSDIYIGILFQIDVRDMTRIKEHGDDSEEER